jgi:outer membrane protein insertion porin family
MQGRWRFLLLVVFGFGGCAAPVRVEDVEGKAVSKVTIRYVGPKTIEEARLRACMGTTAGSVYKADQVDNDIKSLYESGLVNDVRVLAEPKRRGLEVIFEVKTRGVIGPGPGFAGNTVFSDHRLAKQTGVRAGQKIDAPTLLAASRRIEAYYEANGYRGTKVSVRTQTTEDSNLDFIFIIEEGRGPAR